MPELKHPRNYLAPPCCPRDISEKKLLGMEFSTPPLTFYP